MVRFALGCSIIVTTLLAVPALLTAQWETFVTCHELWIDIKPHEGWWGVIPRCMDTLKVGRTRAMPKHPSTATNTCAELYLIGVSPNATSRTLLPTVVECEGPGQLRVIPTQGIPATDEYNRAYYYELRMYCSYWHGPTETDTSTVVFRKATGFRAYSRAVDITTGEEITRPGLVWPAEDAQHHDVTTGVLITATYGLGYDFLYWTCSHRGLLPDSTQPVQLLDSLCWPIGEPVVYTAMYRKATSTVSQRDRQEPHSSYVLFDMLGRITSSGNLGADGIAPNLRGVARGSYLLQTTQGGTHTTSTLIHLE